jgi:hypothetical protein
LIANLPACLIQAVRGKVTFSFSTSGSCYLYRLGGTLPKPPSPRGDDNLKKMHHENATFLHYPNCQRASFLAKLQRSFVVRQPLAFRKGIRLKQADQDSTHACGANRSQISRLPQVGKGIVGPNLSFVNSPPQDFPELVSNPFLEMTGIEPVTFGLQSRRSPS